MSNASEKVSNLYFNNHDPVYTAFGFARILSRFHTAKLGFRD